MNDINLHSLDDFSDSELVIGLVGAVGSELHRVSQFIQNKLSNSGYEVKVIKVSQDVIPLFVDAHLDTSNDTEYHRVVKLMNAGNEARSERSDILALGVMATIHEGRKFEGSSPIPSPRTAYIIDSLKHPDEVKRLRSIYQNGYFTLAVHAEDDARRSYLERYKNLSTEQAQDLIDKDADDELKHGQSLTKTFHLADFFVRMDEDDVVDCAVARVLGIALGTRPFQTPSFDEYAMYMAFSASLRSADLSRQVGAVITKDNEVLALGANDCPAAGGGLYWPTLNDSAKCIFDVEGGRDYQRKCKKTNQVGFDSNSIELANIISRIVEEAPDELEKELLKKTLEASAISDITEYGRVVHAEMAALLSCARSNNSTQDATLFCTTFPCHNCAKHIIAAGIRRVVYIEPYPKSKAGEFHSDAIISGFDDGIEKSVFFEPFVGIGPRRFFDLFSIKHGSGYDLERKYRTGEMKGYAKNPEESEGRLRLQMLPFTYLDLEQLASEEVSRLAIQGER